MQDLIKESASELENLPCINYNLYFGSPADRADKFDNEGEKVQITYDEAIQQILDWHTKQMEKAYEKGRENERKEAINKITTYAETRLSDYMNDWQASDVVEMAKLINNTNII